ncbi:MAG: metal ABC transporter permease, partial [Pseudomonadota bacterium]
MLDDFLVRAGLAGVGAALAAGPLGCFVVWRRLAYFGDATAHGAILGVALALALSAPIELGVLAAALALAVTVASLGGRTLAADTLLGVAAHGALAVGLVAVSFASGPAVDLEGLLFGDILAVGRVDVALVWAGAALVCGLLAWRWRALVTATLSPEIAYAEGVDPRRERLVLSIALALVVAAALKVVGALLITALLIIPAAAARPFARSPEGMAIAAAAIGAGSALGGLRISYILDAPTGPTIVA